jgi:hypothetical protein
MKKENTDIVWTFFLCGLSIGISIATITISVIKFFFLIN